MSMQENSCKEKGSNVVEKVVIVAVKASREVTRTALVWALTHVVQPGDCVKLLVVIPAHSSKKKLWGFSRFTSDCAAGHWKYLSGTISDQKDYITDLCSQMMLQLNDVYDADKTKVKVKVVSGSPCGVVASEAKRAHTSWVVLDKRLRKEAKPCMEQLECNVVVMKRSGPKVLRLNLVGSPKTESEVACPPSSMSAASAEHLKNKYDLWNVIRVPNVTPASSPEHTSFTTTDAGASSLSSLDLAASPFILSEINWDLKRDSLVFNEGNHNLDESDSDTESEELSSPSPSTSFYSRSWMADILSSASEFSKHLVEGSQRSNVKSMTSMSDALMGKFSELDREHEIGMLNHRFDLDLNQNVREVISLSRNAPPEPPPLCSICQHKAPVFGKPPKWFSYAELEHATRGFSQANFLAEGGFGSVHRGVLSDGQVIAVKQYKLASSQGDLEFCSEVEVLSCAQHRNVVMLIGFCVEDKRRLLVYEYICNGSLDSHLYGHSQEPLEWSARQKIAVGAARGLRYLHEECRVGCIVHRDMRPNNILLTHDFEPLVGDFGLARWQPDGDLGVETRIIGTFGYLAPEYTQSGQITEKADVYSFGVVLVELVTGRKAVDVSRPKGQQCLTEWARPLLEKNAVDELIDPCLRNCYSEQEVHSMLHCASLCIRRDPHLRPRMSQVLRMLEGDSVMN
ncbi:inactive protein kinase SELMODRAFT_444075-like [Camellia sinensis]|uniref:inactive protein kinase SELMODRAFT_444075-like n=1 Tax=Camellia sinensis TaxID=4442 RepID=UPI001036ED1E|nr:inactive protein kinase SELMODRAFT_444075-like [Camellia sinensis]